MTRDPHSSHAPHPVVSVVVGRIGRAHGVRGELSVDVRTDEPDLRFADGAHLRAVREPDGDEAGRTLEVSGSRWHQGRLLVRFAEVGDRTAAETLRGAHLLAEVDPAARPEEPEEFYDHQLVGLVAITDGPQPREVGRVREVLHTPGQELLVIERAAGQGAADQGAGDDVLVPFVSDLVPVVDVDGGRLVVVDRPGLLDGTAAGSSAPEG